MAQKHNPVSRVTVWIGGTLFEYLLSATLAVPVLCVLLAVVWSVTGLRPTTLPPTGLAFAWSLLSLVVFLLRDRVQSR